MAWEGESGVVRVGLLGQSGAEACPNLLQRRPGPGSAARRSAEYQRFSFGASARSGPLQQIWTNGAPTGPCTDGGRGDHPAPAPGSGRPRPAPGRRDVHFALERALLTARFEGKIHISTRRGRLRTRPLLRRRARGARASRSSPGGLTADREVGRRGPGRGRCGARTRSAPRSRASARRRRARR